MEEKKTKDPTLSGKTSVWTLYENRRLEIDDTEFENLMEVYYKKVLDD